MKDHDPVNWVTGYSGWSLYCAIISTFGITGYYSDLLKPHVPAWVAVGLFTAPLAAIVFIQWGEQDGRIVAATHIIAASWFMVLSLGMELGGFLRYTPEGSTLFRVLAHLGWSFAWAGVYGRARAYRRQRAESSRPD